MQNQITSSGPCKWKLNPMRQARINRLAKERVREISKERRSPIIQVKVPEYLVVHSGIFLDN